MDYETYSEKMEEASEAAASGNYGKTIAIVAGLVVVAVAYGTCELYRGLRSSQMETVEQIKFYEDKKKKYMKKILEESISDAKRKKLNHSQVSRHKKAHFFRGAGYFVCSQYKASASFGVSILSVPCGLFVL